MSNRSLTVFEKQLSDQKYKLAPLEWASARNNLGYALVSLGQEESDNDTLKQSIIETETALEGCNPVDSLEEWITLQTDLAAALHALGQRKTDETVSLLNKAMEAYKKILPAIKRQEAPLEWALILHNIAMVSQDLGEHSEGPRTLERSVSAYSNALTQRTFDVAPLEWALTQNNAAVSMQIIGQIKQDINILKESIVSYDNAQQMLTLEEHSMAWVITTGNLGCVQTVLAEQTKDSEIARQAVNNLTDIVAFFSDATNSQHLELAEQYRDKAQTVLDKVGG